MSDIKRCVAFVAACVAFASMASCTTEGAPVGEQEARQEARGELRSAARELRAAADQVRALRRAAPDDPGARPEGAEPKGTSVALDVRDRAQKRFVEARLNYVGKTPENSPNLFGRLNQRAQAEPSQILDVLPADCTNPLSIVQDPLNRNRWEARIITSCFDGAEYSYVDLFWWNTQTGEILAYDFNENFDNPRDLTLEILADSTDIGTVIQVDSMAINSRGAEDYYAFDDIIQERPDELAVRDLIAQPSDQNGDGIVTTCLDRGGADCDLFFTGTNGRIMLPLSMSFRFPGVVKSIQQVVGQIHMTNSGGVCKTADLKGFVTTAGAVVTINTNGPIDFGTRCVNNQTKVRFWIMIVGTNTRDQTYSLYWSNDRPTDPKKFDMQFRWSCLAAGSKIAMADGTERLIEKIKLGDRVRSGGKSLSVVDITSGFESAPIVELESDNGGSLVVTQGHPFFDGGGKALRADELEVGSTVKTSGGTAKVTKVERKPYAGKVYNLKLGTDQQIAGLDVDSINMFANGFSVGDSRSQWALEMLRQDQAKSAPLPPEWAHDRQMSDVRKATERLAAY